MHPPAKEYAIATAITVAVVIVIQYLMADSLVDTVLMAVIMGAGYTCAAIGLYMYLEGKGESSINGVDWSELSPKEIRNLISYWGAYMTAGSVLMMYSIAMLMSYMVPGLVLIGASVVLMLVPLLLKDRAKGRVFRERSRHSKMLVFVAVSILAIAPSFYLLNNVDNQEAVTVEFMDDGFSVRAPMVDETFLYSAVEDLGIDPDFDKGRRMMGYGTTEVCCGKFRNAVFGDYRLASYTKVDTCIFFFYEGGYFAFNLYTDELTQEAYEELLSRVS